MPQEPHLLVLGTLKGGREGGEMEDMTWDHGGICIYPAERPPAGLAEAGSVESKVKGENPVAVWAGLPVPAGLFVTQL